MTWRCDNCGKKYVSVHKKPPLRFYSRLPMAKPVGALHSAKLHRVCSFECKCAIENYESLNKEVWAQ